MREILYSSVEAEIVNPTSQKETNTNANPNGQKKRLSHFSVKLSMRLIQLAAFLTMSGFSGGKVIHDNISWTNTWSLEVM